VTETVKSSFHAACPFCGGEFFDARDPDTMEVQGLIHSMPMCDQFRALEPGEYLKAVNDLNASAVFDPLMKKEPGKT
jgi:hypothetical protein